MDIDNRLSARQSSSGMAAGGRGTAGRGASGPSRAVVKSPTKSSGWKEVEKAAPAQIESTSRRRKKDRPGSRSKDRTETRGRRGVAPKGAQASAKSGKRGRGKAPAEERSEKTAARKKDARKWTLMSVSPRTVIILILFVLFIALSASPVARNLEATGKLKAMEKELSKQQKVTKSLENEVNQARSLSYIEQEARKERLVAPDEVLYLVTTDSAEPTVEYRLKALQSMDEAWEQVRKLLHCSADRQVHSH